MYRAKDSVYKQLVRQYLYKATASHIPKGSSGNIMTLSNSCVWLENKLVDHINNRKYNKIAYCYERDVETYNNLVYEIKNENYAHIGLKAINKDIFDFDSGLKYCFVWLDFCNSYTDDFMTRIADMVGRIKFSDKAVLSITLARTRGKANEDLEYNKVFKNYKDEGFAAHMLQFLPYVENITRVQYKCADISTKAIPMNVFNFFINKTI